MANIGIIGAGSWGIALSYLLHNNGHQVTVWSALPQEVEELREKAKLTVVSATSIKEGGAHDVILKDHGEFSSKYN